MNTRTLVATCVALSVLACETRSSDAPPPLGVRVAPLGTAPLEPIDALGKTDKIVYDDRGELVDPFGDSDGDGISDRDEVLGWTLTLDPDGWAAFLADGGAITVGGTAAPHATVEQHVTSDPRFADSDGDGVDDGVERASQSDPRKWDSDGDGLTDREEIERFGTNPSRVDSDGDATGGDPKQPRPPLAALFDGAELDLVIGPDGERRPGPRASNPSIADTDSDGVNDYDELLSGTRQRALAEIPEISVTMAVGSALEMYLNVETSEQHTDTRTYGTSLSFDESVTASTSFSGTATIANEDYAEAYASTSDTFGCCIKIAESENEVGIRYQHKTSLAMSMSSTFGGGLTLAGRHATNEARAKQVAGQLTMKGGTVRLALDVSNTGPVAVRLSDLAIGMSRWDAYTRLYQPVTELLPADEDLGVLAPGTSRTVIVEDDAIALDPMLALLDDPRQLYFTASRFNMADQSGASFAFTLDDVDASTFTLAVEEPDRARRFLIGFGEPDGGVTLRDALQIARIDGVQVRSLELGGDRVDAVTIGELGTEFYEGPAPDLGDTRPYTHSGGPGPRWVKRGWFVQVRRADPSAEHDYYPNMLDALMYVGDEVRLVYDEDLDRDGVPARVEAALGSSDHAIQSDESPAFPAGDGLSDFWEAYEYWEVAWEGRAPYRVRGSPGLVDADGDGLDDAAEADAGLDPRMADTDLDTLWDKAELDGGGDPLHTLPAAAQAPSVTCTVDNQYLNDTAVYVIHIVATDPQGDLVTVLLESLLPAGDYAAFERYVEDPSARYGYTERLTSDVAAINIGQKVTVIAREDGSEAWVVDPTDRMDFYVSDASHASGCYIADSDTFRPAFTWHVSAVDAGGHRTSVGCTPIGLLVELGCLY